MNEIAMQFSTLKYLGILGGTRASHGYVWNE